MAFNAAAARKVDAASMDQASRGGVEVADAMANAGGIAGFFGGKEVTKHYTAGRTADTTTDANKAAIAARIAQLEGRPNIQMQGATVNDQFRGAQAALAGQLAGAATGAGPSAAQAQLQTGIDAAGAQAMSLAKSGRGNPGVAMRQAMDQQAALGATAANQSAMLKANEVQNARAQLAGVLQGARGQDFDTAGLQQSASQANMAAAIQQQAQKDELVNRYMTQGMTLDQARHAAELQQAQFNAEILARQAAADKGVAMQSSAAAGQQIGQAAAAIAGTIASAASDVRVKTNIEDGALALGAFLDALGTYKYRYAEPQKHGAGVFVSPMAQEIEATDLGRHLVSEAPDGTKIVDYGKALGLMLALLVDTHRRLSKLEGK